MQYPQKEATSSTLFTQGQTILSHSVISDTEPAFHLQNSEECDTLMSESSFRCVLQSGAL